MIVQLPRVELLREILMPKTLSINPDSSLDLFVYQTGVPHTPLCLKPLSCLLVAITTYQTRPYPSQFAIAMHNFRVINASFSYNGRFRVLKQVAAVGSFSCLHSGFPIFLIAAYWKYRESVMKKNRFWNSMMGRLRAHVSNRACNVQVTKM